MTDRLKAKEYANQRVQTQSLEFPVHINHYAPQKGEGGNIMNQWPSCMNSKFTMLLPEPQS